ncbi:MAG: response regulator [Deltaproteobacteria bacterium]|nr:response regulator [Deltaproteobacteria bacterium]
MDDKFSQQRPLMLITVDDDPDQINLIQGLCKEMWSDLAFKAFTSGEELLSYFFQIQNLPHSYDQVILLDVNMPKMSGFETLEEIRRMRDFETEPKIAMITGSVDQKRRQTSIDLGANLILEKPFELEGWKQILESVVQLSTKH